MTAILILILSFIVGDAGTDEKAKPAEYQLLLPGLYHANDCSAVSGEKWWGVLLTKRGQELKQVSLDIELVHDSMMGDKEGEKTGKKVSDKASGEGKFIFFVDGLKEAKQGPIDGFFSGEIPLWPRPHSNNYPPLCTRIRLGDGKSLFVCADGSMVGLGKDYSISICEGQMERFDKATAQCIFESTTEFDFTVPKLLWVGDIDRDGKRDLLLDLSNKYAGSAPTLFLSSKHESGNMVGLAAQLVIGYD